MSHRVRLALVILAAAAVYLIGNDRVPLWDRDEPRNAQAARQMLESGDWVVPRFLDKVRTAKPPFTYWCQATAMSIFGGNAFAARLPSVVALTITLITLAGLLTRTVKADGAPPDSSAPPPPMTSSSASSNPSSSIRARRGITCCWCGVSFSRGASCCR